MNVNLTINVDSDSVVANFDKAMVEWLERDGLKPDLSTWNLGVSREDFNRVFAKAIKGGLFARLEPEEGAVWGLKTLQAQGHRVRIVTSKTCSSSHLTLLARVDTLWFYQRLGLGQLEVSFTGSQYGKHGYEADVVIDDSPHLLTWAQRGALNLLFDQPWNQDVTYPPGHRFTEVHGWDEVVHFVNKESERRDR